MTNAMSPNSMGVAICRVFKAAFGFFLSSFNCICIAGSQSDCIGYPAKAFPQVLSHRFRPVFRGSCHGKRRSIGACQLTTNSCSLIPPAGSVPPPELPPLLALARPRSARRKKRFLFTANPPSSGSRFCRNDLNVLRNREPLSFCSPRSVAGTGASDLRSRAALGLVPFAAGPIKNFELPQTGEYTPSL